MIGGSNHPVFDHEIVGVVADTHVTVRDQTKETYLPPTRNGKSPERLGILRADGGRYGRPGAYDSPRGAGGRSQCAHGHHAIRGRADRRGRIYTQRLIALLSGAFGLLATLLAAIGLYGVVAYAVTRRTAEIGVRMALGARPSAVLRMILVEAGRMAAVGIAIGLLAAVGVSRLVASQLYGVNATDPAVFAAAAAVLAAVALAAALVPGWRASRIEPVAALKYE